jgi:5-methylcytosine-specific restriction endonuclease McrA
MHYNQGMARPAYVWDDTRRDAYHRRRALRKGASTGQPVRLSEIAARDNYACGLCLEPVDMDLPFPKWGSPSQDHATPLTRGGVHDPSNVLLAHLGCNLEKKQMTLEEWFAYKTVA